MRSSIRRASHRPGQKKARSREPKKILCSRKCGLPDEVLGGNDRGGDGVAKGMQLNLLVALQVLFAQENVEVGGFLD